MTEVKSLGKYRITGELGRGAFATVYRAVDTTLDREVALKVLHPLLMTDATWIARFRQEAKMIAGLKHAHIVTIYEIGEHEGRLYIAMGLATGGSLADAIVKRGKIPWAETLGMLKPVCEALDYAHGQGVVHRDLKPANILLDTENGVMLTDFGLARLFLDNHASLSVSGGILGTPAYIAPEIWELDAATSSTDIYALGCLAYEMLMAEVLFAGKTPMQAVRAHAEGPRYKETWPDDIHPLITQVLDKTLAREPARRYTAAMAFWHALADLEKRIGVEREDAERATIVAQWREETKAAMRAGEWDVAKLMAGRWLAAAPDDPDAFQTQSRINQELAIKVLQQHAPPTPVPAARQVSSERVAEHVSPSLHRAPDAIRHGKPKSPQWVLGGGCIAVVGFAFLIVLGVTAIGWVLNRQGQQGMGAVTHPMEVGTVSLSAATTLAVALVETPATPSSQPTQTLTPRPTESPTSTPTVLPTPSPIPRPLISVGNARRLALERLVAFDGDRCNGVWSMAVSPDNDTMALAPNTPNNSQGYLGVKLWSLSQSRLLYALPHGEYVADPWSYYVSSNALAFFADASRLVSAAGSNTGGDVSVWNTVSGVLEHSYAVGISPSSRIWNIVVSPNDMYIGVGGLAKPAIRIVRAADGTLLQTFEGTGTALAFTPDSQRVVTASDNGVKIWWVGDGSLSGKLDGFGFWPMALDVSSDGRLLAAGTGYRGGGGEVQIWDIDRGVRVSRVYPRRVVRDLQLSPDGSLLATTGSQAEGSGNVGTLDVWDTSTAELLVAFDHVGSLHFTRFWRNGRALVAGSSCVAYIYSVGD